MAIKNRFEQRIYNLLKKKKVSFQSESERIPFILSGYYLPDFVIDGPLGKIYIETKGYLRPEAKRKLVAVKKLHPTLDIRILFYAFKPKDVKWAEKNKFPFAIETIPTEWMEELV